MITSEVQLLQALHACGFDFRSTARNLAARFPQQLDWGVPHFEVIPFQLTKPFAGLGDLWKIPVNRDLEFDLPPTRYKYEFHPTRDAKTNHDRALAQLVSHFGAGETSPATNVYGSHWRIGYFTVRITTWPRELNARNTNSFEGRNPYLWISANITIEPDFPFILDNTSIEESSPAIIIPEDNVALVCDSLVYTRRNKMPATPAAGLTRDSFFVRGHDRTLAVPIDHTQKIVHTRMTPGRFTGSSSLALESLFLNRHKVRVTVANGSKTASLDRLAHQIAGAIKKPLTVEEYSDDG